MKLIIYGIGDFAILMAHYFMSDSPYDVVAFCADEKYITKESLNNLPIVSFENLQNEFPSKEYEIFVAVGYKSMRNRKKMYENIKEKGYKCATYVSSKAVTDSSNVIGENCVILHGSILEPFASIAHNSFINTGVTLCHHVEIEQHSFLAAGSLIGGFTKVKENSFVGFNATVLQKLVLAKETLIGASSLVVHNTNAYTKYIGSPAKKISMHPQNGIEIID